MFNAKRVLLPCLTAGILAASLGTARAEDNVVLFKIHDIVPVKNADGNITSCELGATFYNRLKSEVRNASLTLMWHDEVVSDTIEQESRAAREDRRLNRGRGVSRYNTATYNDRDLTLQLKLPPLKPLQQVTLKSKILSDRCFLLLGDVDVKVNSCGSGASTGRKAVAEPNCANLFEYVSAQSPQYYSEFKEKTVEQQQAEETNMMEKQRQEIDELYGSVNNELNKLTASFTAAEPPAVPQ